MDITEKICSRLEEIEYFLSFDSTRIRKIEIKSDIKRRCDQKQHISDISSAYFDFDLSYIIDKIPQGISLDTVSFDTTDIEHGIIRIYAITDELDEKYLKRLDGIYSSCVKMYTHEEHLVLILYKLILSKLYVARNITLDKSIILECLCDLDKIYNADNDHNGESSEIDCIVQEYNVLDQLMKKYNV